MPKVILDTQEMIDIADAIRSKTGSSSTMKVKDMPNEIQSISGGDGSGKGQINITSTSKAFNLKCECLLDDLSYFCRTLDEEVTPNLILKTPSIVNFSVEHVEAWILLDNMADSNVSTTYSHYHISFGDNSKILNLISYDGTTPCNKVSLVVDNDADIIIKYINFDENEPS